jgi:hypothetical protein
MTLQYWSPRYGDLESIAAETRGLCHLCHEPVDLDLYGRTGEFGPDTVTVDHLRPQVRGGGDGSANLRIAHGDCNSVRGTRSPRKARLALAGTADEPMSQVTFDLLSIGAGVGVAAVSGRAFATHDEQGRPQFNWGAAALFGILTFAVVRSF